MSDLPRQMNNFAKTFAAAQRRRATKVAERTTPSATDIVAPSDRDASLSETATVPPMDLRIEVERLTALMVERAAAVGRFRPARLERLLSTETADRKVLQAVMSRFSALCVPAMNEQDEPFWILRAGQRRTALKDLGEAGHSALERALTASDDLRVRDDPFTKALRLSLRGKSPSIDLVSEKNLAATLAALEFAFPSIVGAPDPSAYRLKLAKQDVHRDLSWRANPIRRLATFNGFLRDKVAGTVIMVLWGGTPDERSELMQNLRGALFRDTNRSVAYLDFRRPSLLAATVEAVATEVAIQFMQQEEGGEYWRLAPGSEAAIQAAGLACQKSRDAIVLCEGWDHGRDLADLEPILEALRSGNPEAQWRFAVSHQDRITTIGCLRVTHFSRAARPRSAQNRGKDISVLSGLRKTMRNLTDRMRRT